jgi:hypothetical protein
MHAASRLADGRGGRGAARLAALFVPVQHRLQRGRARDLIQGTVRTAPKLQCEKDYGPSYRAGLPGTS